jgi:hypothetical protein
MVEVVVERRWAMAKTILSCGDLTPEEWKRLEALLGNHAVFGPTFWKLRNSGNKPQKAALLLPRDLVNNGHEVVNALLRTEKLPFRLTTVGRWQNGVRYRLDRSERPIAFVRWQKKEAS